MKKSSSASTSKPLILGDRTANVRDLYELGSNLGQGYFGTTVLCTEISTGKQYACKSIAKRKLLCEEDVEDVRREIKIMRRLSGLPNVVTIKSIHEDLVDVHLVMELCAGGELFDRIAHKGNFTEKEAARLMKTIVSVVEALHSRGIMHRDLKPENFLFASDDEDAALKATDFGLSAYCNQGATFSEVVGSPYYVAPEVLCKHYGPKADIWSAGVILYMLLSGVPPFLGETEPGTFVQILKASLDFESEPWPRISESAKDLIQKMLERNPNKRLAAHEVLCHPWILDDKVAPDKPLDSVVLSRLKEFSAKKMLQKMTLRVVAENLSEEEIGGLKKLFLMFDTDRSGAITFDELKDGLKRLGSELTEGEIYNLMASVDINNSGTIDYGEFISATLDPNKAEREENLLAAFSSFDKDGSGYITIDELQLACKEIGLNEVDLERMMKEIDADNDVRIDYRKFVEMVT